LLNSIRDGRTNTKNAGLPADAFLDLFKAISTLNNTQPSATPTSVDLSIPEVENGDDVGGIESCDNEGDELDVKVGVADAEKEVEDTEPKEDFNLEKEKQKMRIELNQALQQNPYDVTQRGSVMKIFEEVRSSPHELLENNQIISIFYHIVKCDLSAGYDVLHYYVARCKEQGRIVPLYMYHGLIKEFRGVELKIRAPRHNNNPRIRPMTTDEVQGLVGDVSRHIREEYGGGKRKVYQHLLLPELVAALSCHRNPFVNSYAKPIMEYILDNDFPQLNPELYEHILAIATHRNTGSDYSLPHSRVLSQLVSNGYRPKPETVVNLLHCMHPFDDHEATHEILSVIQKLHPEDASSSLSADEDYRVELGILESISMASARKNIDLNLLVWDIVELFGYNPTESMFEDVIMSFAATKQDENMFTAMVDMEKNGFVPSHSLLRYVAVKVAFSKKRLDHSQKMLAWHGNEHIRSTHTMNAVMMGYGMNRDINAAFFVYEDLARFNLKPDATTFWFLMEILYIDTKDRFPYQSENPPEFKPEDIEDVVGAAQIILDAMEEAGMEKTSHFYHEYIRVLCALGQLDEAYSVLEEAIRSKTPLPAKSLFLLATRYTYCGEVDKAYAIEKLSEAAGCGPLPHLNNRIRNIHDGMRRSREPEESPPTVES